MIPLVTASLPMCEDTIEISSNCAMVTPSVNCTTYTIINTEGVNVSSGDLTHLYDTIYYFNFTEGSGDYVVQLCDLTTREVRVKQGEDRLIGLAMIIGIVLAFFIVLTIFFALIKNQLTYAFFLFSYVFATVIMFIGASIADTGGYAFAQVLYKVYIFMLYMMFVLFVVIVLHYLNVAINLHKKKKQDRYIEEMGGEYYAGR